MSKDNEPVKRLKIKVDLAKVLNGDGFIKYLEKLFSEYEEWNQGDWNGTGRDDGLIIHTDCLDDFICWLKNRKKNA